MPILLSPGIRLLARFGFARKFQILFLQGCIFIPLAWVSAIGFKG